MKTKLSILILLFSLLISCGNTTEDIEFANNVSGRYLFNPDEIIQVFHENGRIYFKWRGAEKITPLKIEDGVYFIKEMNEKIQFLKNPQDNKYYISMIPKDKSKSIGFDFIKLDKSEYLPSYYLKNNEFEKALIGYKSIKEYDSLSPYIKESHFNSMGYRLMRNNDFEYALNVFKLNAALYPESSNVYDSLGDALMRNGDTIQSVKSYRKSLELDSNNGRARRIIDKHGKE